MEHPSTTGAGRVHWSNHAACRWSKEIVAYAISGVGGLEQFSNRAKTIQQQFSITFPMEFPLEASYGLGNAILTTLSRENKGNVSYMLEF